MGKELWITYCCVCLHIDKTLKASGIYCCSWMLRQQHLNTVVDVGLSERAQDHVCGVVRKAEKLALSACVVIALGHVDQVECIWCIRCLIAISKLVGVGEDNVSAAHSFLQHAMLKVGHLREVGILLDVPARHGADSQATLVLMLQAWQGLGEGYDSEATWDNVKRI